MECEITLCVYFDVLQGLGMGIGVVNNVITNLDLNAYNSVPYPDMTGYWPGAASLSNAVNGGDWVT